jgi:hypothetical protein
MAEQVVIVCDVCGEPAVGSVTVAVHGGGSRDGQKYAKDLCERHLSELLANTRKPRRGRRRGSVNRTSAAAPSETQVAPATRRRRRTTRTTRTAAPSATAAPRRRGRPRKTATVSDDTGTPAAAF